jgi:hypothetical protein
VSADLLAKRGAESLGEIAAEMGLAKERRGAHRRGKGGLAVLVGADKLLIH